MTAGGPTGAALEERGVVTTTDQQYARSNLLLEMTLQTEALIALGQHPLINRTVRLMAGEATFSKSFVLENVRSTLNRMALETGFIETCQLGAASFHRIAFVRFVAGGATHLSFKHWMMMRQIECGARFKMTLKAGFR